jgi:hypothetical protein
LSKTKFIPLAASLIALAVSPIMGQTGYRFFNPANADSIPKLISETGMYKNILTKEINTDVIPFEVNTPLWTDGAFKERYIAIPSGASVIYDDTADIYAYPDRAMVIKNFSVDTIPGNIASRILFETRFSGVRIVSGKERWYLWTYRWRLDQTDADLVATEGQSVTVNVYRNGTDSAPVLKKWRFPSRIQCAACHRVQGTGGRTVLAFFTAQLNKPLASNPSVNQLDRLFQLGVLKMKTGAKPDFSKSPKWASINDETATLEHRSRSYLAANCSGCHGQKGIATGAVGGVTIDYDYHDLAVRTDLVTKKLYASFPLVNPGLIVPGFPERSVIIYRQKMRNQKDQDFSQERMAMPPLGSYEPDTTAIKVMSQWVTAMPGSSIHGVHAGKAAGAAVRIRGSLLEITGPLAQISGEFELADLKGARIPLTRIQTGLFRMEKPLAPGIHFLMSEGRIIQRIAP